MKLIKPRVFINFVFFGIIRYGIIFIFSPTIPLEL